MTIREQNYVVKTRLVSPLPNTKNVFTQHKSRTKVQWLCLILEKIGQGSGGDKHTFGAKPFSWRVQVKRHTAPSIALKLSVKQVNYRRMPVCCIWRICFQKVLKNTGLQYG